MAVARVTRVISSSKKGFQEAVDNAVARADESIQQALGN